MSARGRKVSPAMQALIDQQKARFTPEDLLPAVRLMRHHALEASTAEGAAA